MSSLKGVPLTPQQHAAAAWRSQAITDRIGRARTLANQWAATVTGATVLLGAGTLVSSDTVVHDLTPSAAASYGIWTAISLLAFLLAILIATRAAQGRVAILTANLPDIVKEQNKEFTQTVVQLRISQALTAIAIIALVVAFSIRWYGPQAPGSKAAWTVTKTSSGYIVQTK